MKQPLSCKHLDTAVIQPVGEDENACEECVKTGSSWVHLRKCLTCGAVLCCDSSPNKHMSTHAKTEGHPVAISAEPGERWAWCYEDEIFQRY